MFCIPTVTLVLKVIWRHLKHQQSNEHWQFLRWILWTLCGGFQESWDVTSCPLVFKPLCLFIMVIQLFHSTYTQTGMNHYKGCTEVKLANFMHLVCMSNLHILSHILYMMWGSSTDISGYKDIIPDLEMSAWNLDTINSGYFIIEFYDVQEYMNCLSYFFQYKFKDL